MSKTILKHAHVQFLEKDAPVPPAPFGARPPACVGPKRATLIEQVGKPCAIEFTCSCGETTLIEIDHPGEEGA